jgi:hypothetical protein
VSPSQCPPGLCCKQLQSLLPSVTASSVHVVHTTPLQYAMLSRIVPTPTPTTHPCTLVSPSQRSPGLCCTQLQSLLPSVTVSSVLVVHTTAVSSTFRHGVLRPYSAHNCSLFYLPSQCPPCMCCTQLQSLLPSITVSSVLVVHTTPLQSAMLNRLVPTPTPTHHEKIVRGVGGWVPSVTSFGVRTFAPAELKDNYISASFESG